MLILWSKGLHWLTSTSSSPAEPCHKIKKTTPKTFMQHNSRAKTDKNRALEPAAAMCSIGLPPMSQAMTSNKSIELKVCSLVVYCQESGHGQNQITQPLPQLAGADCNSPPTRPCNLQITFVLPSGGVFGVQLSAGWKRCLFTEIKPNE